MNSITLENPLAGVPDWILRPALPEDEAQIRALVRAEKLNPTGIAFPTFHVVSVAGTIVGAAQIRRHRDGSREFGSLVVAPDFRGCGIGRALIHALLARERGRLHVITSRHGAKTWERLGFRRVSGWAAPPAIRRNLLIGRAFGLLARLRGRRPLGLRVLERPMLAGPFAQPATSPAAMRVPQFNG